MPVTILNTGMLLCGKESSCKCRRHRRCGLDFWVKKIPWRRTWQPTPVFLPGEFHGQRSLVGYSPWSQRVGHDWATNAFKGFWDAVEAKQHQISRDKNSLLKARLSHQLAKPWAILNLSGVCSLQLKYSRQTIAKINKAKSWFFERKIKLTNY